MTGIPMPMAAPAAQAAQAAEPACNPDRHDGNESENQGRMDPTAPIRIIMLGTGDFALPMFELLCEQQPTGARITFWRW